MGHEIWELCDKFGVLKLEDITQLAYNIKNRQS